MFKVAIGNGTSAVVIRYISRDPERVNTLYLHTGRRYVCEDGACRMLDPEVAREAVLIASEPLSDDSGWQPVNPNSLVIIDSDHRIELRDL